MKKSVFILIAISTIVVGCNPKLFPSDDYNTLTIGQKALSHRRVAYISTGNHNDGTTASLWRYENATHPDSVALWGYVMYASDRTLSKYNMTTVFEHINGRLDSGKVDFTNRDSGIIHKKLTPGKYSITVVPVTPLQTGFLFSDLKVSGGDSLAFTILLATNGGPPLQNYNTEYRAYSSKLSLKKWHQRLFTNDYLYFDVNGKRVKKKVTRSNYRRYLKARGIEKPKKR